MVTECVAGLTYLSFVNDRTDWRVHTVTLCPKDMLGHTSIDFNMVGRQCERCFYVPTACSDILLPANTPSVNPADEVGSPTLRDGETLTD